MLISSLTPSTFRTEWAESPLNTEYLVILLHFFSLISFMSTFLSISNSFMNELAQIQDLVWRFYKMILPVCAFTFPAKSDPWKVEYPIWIQLMSKSSHSFTHQMRRVQSSCFYSVLHSPCPLLWAFAAVDLFSGCCCPSPVELSDCPKIFVWIGLT